MHYSINRFSASEPKVFRLPYSFIAVQGKADQSGNLSPLDSMQYSLGLKSCWSTVLEEQKPVSVLSILSIGNDPLWMLSSKPFLDILLVSASWHGPKFC